MTAPSRPDGYLALSSDATDTDGAHSEPDSLSHPLLTSPETTGLTLATPHGGTLTVYPDGEGYTYAYGPTGLSGLLHNSYVFRCAIFASIGGLTFGYDQGVIANVLVMTDFIQRWPIGSWEKGLMSSALQCFAKSLSQIVLGRAIGGFGVGALSMLSPLYMAEISPPEVRGSLMSLEQFSIVLGCVIGFWTGFFTRNIVGSLSWRVPLGLQLVPGILLAFGSFFLPPSPRLLVYRGKNDEALASLAKLRLRSSQESTSDPLLQIELLEMQVEADLIQQTTGTDDKNRLRNEALAWARLFDHKYIDRTLVGVLIMFFQQWSGINALIYYGPMLLQSLGLTGSTVNLLVAGGINVVQLIAVFPAILYIDQWGRKPLLRAGSAMMTCSHLAVYEFGGNWTEHSVAATVSICCLYLFIAAYGMSFGPVGWVLPSEVFPLSMRSKGVSLSTASVWLNNFLIGLVTPALMEISASGTFMVFACACFAAYLWSTYVVPETANVSLEEIDAVFRSSAGLEDAQLKKQVRAFVFDNHIGAAVLNVETLSPQIERDLGLYDLIKGLVAGEE
ncbi:hypothetical protein EW146_g4483 [Bondarzewia mesenterica]|uniref:Major facilitator superfamily (MFS) profile domain-containing protein n=1 Tax=Bondarzewia mesenterica TaxID=1095465 RepID=A0A4S4LUZ0_9AGAM|nr:hypothetical protein EW146_g4483 [Bondarzewia mesenterica]